MDYMASRPRSSILAQSFALSLLEALIIMIDGQHSEVWLLELNEKIIMMMMGHT